MITVTESVPDFDTFHEILDYDPENCLFFDIETTGFSADFSMVFLIGALVREPDGWKLTQFLAEKPADEPLLLQAFADLAAGRDTLLHFNGSTFDIPYLQARAKRLFSEKALQSGGSLSDGFQLFPSIISDSSSPETAATHMRSVDLYQHYRPLKKLLSLEHMNQSALECLLGWQREDRLTGKHMVSLFQKYAASGEPGLRALLLLHNHDDMLGMTQLLKLAPVLALFDGRSFVFAGAERAADGLRVRGRLRWPLPFPITTENRFLQLHTAPPFSALPENNNTATSLMLSENDAETPSSASPENDDAAVPPALPENTDAELLIPILRDTLCHFFPDYRNYYYLPLEDQAIHKSVAAFVDRNCRQPAKAANCYIKKSGEFLPQPEELFSPAFQRSLESRELYFLYSEDFIRDEAQMQKYAATLTRSCGCLESAYSHRYK